MESTRVAFNLIVLFGCLGLTFGAKGDQPCSKNTDCGFNSQCTNSSCSCIGGFVPLSSGEHCTNPDCSFAGCLVCNAQQQCQRCTILTYFMDLDSRTCVRKCPASYSVRFSGEITGAVCDATNSDSGLDSGYLAIIIVVCCGFVITVAVGIALYCCCLRRTAESPSRRQAMEMNKYDQPSVNYDNPIYGTASQLTSNYGSSSSDSEYYDLVTQLRPHTETFTKMIHEADTKLGQVEGSQLKYAAVINVVYHLSRVISVLNNPDDSSDVPPDGVSLMLWAEGSLHRFLAQANTTNNQKVQNGSVRPLVLTTFKTTPTKSQDEERHSDIPISFI